MPPEIAVEEVLTTEALENLRPQWSDLWARCPDATPFQSPEWLVPWWKHIGEGELWTLALRDKKDGRLIGLAPVYVYTQPGSGSRDVFPLGIATTDYLDPLLLPGREQDCLAAVWSHLDARRDRWDVCEWPQLRPDSPVLSAPVPAGWQSESGESEPCPILPLPSTVAELAQTLPNLPRRKLRYYHRRAASRGASLRMEAATGKNALDLFNALVRQHEARWESKAGEAGVLADAAVQRAHRETLPGLLALGALRLYALHHKGEAGEQIIGVFYGLADPAGVFRTHPRVYCYIGGFEPDFAEFGPGSILIGHAIEEAVKGGAAAVDFLRGQEPYKYVWGARDTPTFRRRLWHGGGAGR